MGEPVPPHPLQCCALLVGEGRRAIVFGDIPRQSEQKKYCLLVSSLNLKTPYGFMVPAIARPGEQYAAGRGYLPMGRYAAPFIFVWGGMHLCLCFFMAWSIARNEV